MTAPLRSHRRPAPATAATSPQARLRAVRATAPAPRPARIWPSRRRATVVVGGLMFVAVLAGNVVVHAATTQGQFDLERLRGQASEQEASYQQLRLQVAKLQAPDRIVEEARRLGMVEPPRVTYLTPTAQTSAEVPPPASTLPEPPAEAAQRWGQVKPHLGAGR